MGTERPATVRARCARLLAELGIDRHATGTIGIADIARQVEQRRGRPLELVGVVVPPHCPSGIWVGTDTADVIIFDKATSPLHQLHILLHEVGHMLLGHTGSVRQLDVAAMFRNLLPDPVAPVMLRSGYGDREEHEAEVFATMASERLGDIAIPAGGVARTAQPELITRLLATIADQQPPAP